MHLFLFGSSFLQRANLTVRTPSIPVTRVVLDGQQVNAIARVNVNEAFSVSVMPIDRSTRRALGKVQWGNWSWKANASLYSLPKFNRPGMLILNGSSTTEVDTSKNTVTLTNLKINGTGMYVLNLSLTSTNNEHLINLLSYAILVQDKDGRPRWMSDASAFYLLSLKSHC
jgi:hypothetical protein